MLSNNAPSAPLWPSGIAGWPLFRHLSLNMHITSDNGQQHDSLHFFYDAQNRPAIVAYNGTPYSYVKNLQGDIVAILDSSKNIVVSYAYDAWGRPISCSGTMASTLGKINPFRYRAYVYDEETGLYYLRSRYYASDRCRFINEDNIVNGNLYTYSLCSPIKLIDPSGRCVVVVGYAEDGEEEISFGNCTCFYSPKLQPIPGIELMTKEDLKATFIMSKEYVATLTDLISGISFQIEWKPKDQYHTDFWFDGEAAKKTARECLRVAPKQNWDEPESWSKNARPGMLAVQDEHGLERKIAVGFVLFPHVGNYSEFSQDGEMCMFYGDDTMGYARDHGNEAALNAYRGYFVESKQRKPAD